MHRFISSPEDDSLKFQEKTVEVKRAPEPTDILWNNLNYSSKSRLKARLVSFVITLLIIAFCFAIIIVINWAQVIFFEGTRMI